jgi:hypothetical protein
MDPMNNAQSWEDFQRLVTHVVSTDANLRKVRASIGKALNKIKPTTKEGFGGLIKALNFFYQI